MNADGIGQRYFVRLGKIIFRYPVVIKLYGKHFRLQMNGGNEPEFSIEYAFSPFQLLPPVARPGLVVVVADLHDLIAHTEGLPKTGKLCLSAPRRIDKPLQFAVERNHTALPFFHRRNHLPIPLCAELLQVMPDLPRVFRLAQFKPLPRDRHLPSIDAPGIEGDGASLSLSKDGIQRRDREAAALDKVMQHMSRAHGGQLVGISNEYHPRPLRDRPQQMHQQKGIHHRHLVYDYGVCLQWMVLILAVNLFVLLAPAIFQ